MLTFFLTLPLALRVLSRYLTHDHYYKDLSHLPPEERAKTNFDHPDSLETDLLVQHIRLLKQGETAVLPTYDFKTHSRTPVTTLVHPKRIIIVEGILLFTHPELCSELDLKVFVVRSYQFFLVLLLLTCLRLYPDAISLWGSFLNVHLLVVYFHSLRLSGCR